MHKAFLCTILVFVSACNFPTVGEPIQPSPTQRVDTTTSAPPSETPAATHTFPPIITFPSTNISTETPTPTLTFTPTFL